MITVITTNLDTKGLFNKTLRILDSRTSIYLKQLLVTGNSYCFDCYFERFIQVAKCLFIFINQDISLLLFLNILSFDKSIKITFDVTAYSFTSF